MGLARLIYESQYFIRVSFDLILSYWESSRSQRRGRSASQYRLCPALHRAAFSRRKIYGLRGIAVSRKSVTIIRYNRDNEIVLRHVRALTGRNPSNATARRP